MTVEALTDRVKEVKRWFKLQNKDLAALWQVSDSQVNAYLNGYNKVPADALAALLVQFPAVSARWLITGQGVMIEAVTGGDMSQRILSRMDELQRLCDHLQQSMDELQERAGTDTAQIHSKKAPNEE